MKDYRKAYGLPERYFLSLGRMVEKKNLATLVSAYARYAQGVAVAGEKLKVKGNDVGELGAGSLEQGGATADPRLPKGHLPEGYLRFAEPRFSSLVTCHSPASLVFVGSGELESALREQARGLGLRVVDRTAAGSQSSGASRQEGNAEDCKLNTEHSAENDCGAVFFYGFRQIEENPVFYALAEAFILPSLKEEWGLVVNEAMAAGLPVIVSRTAGCAEDLVPMTSASWSSQLADGSWQHAKTEDRKLSTDDSLEQCSNGFVFDPNSVEALSEALKRISDQKTKYPRGQETSLLTEMGTRSREIVAKFSCENFARQALRAAEAAQQA